MSAPQIIKDLVARFQENRDAYISGAYNETQLRQEFLNPFFEALGWDVYNKNGYAEAYKDVIHEDAIKVGGYTKAPDYCFRIGGVRKFFVEAKKPSVNVKEDISPAFQLRRYAWSAKLRLSILTDFEEFAVYDCRIKPNKTDKPANARILYLTYNDYVNRWDEIASVFSREAILKGSFDRYAETGKGKRGTAEVDAEFLKEIERWRELLARTIALRNPGLSQHELNFAVQQTIDRIIFLRICEDRGIDEYNRLHSVVNGANVYRRLCDLFRKADEKYNSGLFHFSQEKGRGEPDRLTLNLIIDDKPLKEIIAGLYYPECPYEFSVLSADILGQVYEQFLGKVIRLTNGHRAVVEDKPEVKKAGGVYYTPTYIVDYIVKNTVGKIVDNRSTPKNISSLRILDPACGSGSFLIGAYQYLLDRHRDWYVANNPQKWATGRKPALYQAHGGEWRLTTAERKRILLNNIYGVDIDPQAVEVTKLSLLLKVLEGESEQTLSKQLRMFHERALPDLDNNIKCGNSLIGPDFYKGRQIQMFNDEERLRINVFDWHTEFPEIMRGGGFDIVIGNPPYVRQEMLGGLKTYFQMNYKTYHGTADLYVYFIERGISLLKEGGLFGYIVANKWMRANYGEPLRRWLKQQRIERIVDFGDLPVFQQATTYPCILVVSKREKSNPHPAIIKRDAEGVDVTQVTTLAFDSLESYIQENHYHVSYQFLDDKGWSLSDDATQKLLDTLKSRGVPLGDYVQGKIYYGIKTGLNEAFVISEITKDRLIAEDKKSAELIKPFLAGKEIKRYHPPDIQKYLILIPKGWTRIQSGNEKNAWNWFIQNYPAVARHLQPFQPKAEKRYDKGDYWWELRACDYYSAFKKQKILYPDIAAHSQFTYAQDEIYMVNTLYFIPLDDLYLLGLLNSKLLECIIHSFSPPVRGGYYRYFSQYIKQLPIRTINFADPTEKARHDRMVEMVEQMLSLNKQLAAARTAHEKAALQRQIEATDRQIDFLVYELYSLTDEEIRIVEGK